MRKNITNTNGFVYLINAAIFSVINIIKPLFFEYLILFLSFGLVLLFMCLPKQYFSKENAFNFGSFKVLNISGLLVSFLFFFNSILYFKYIEYYEIIYVSIFCFISVLTTVNGKIYDE